ncbi:pilin [Paraburkholderia aromaticivorans]|uniref:pilin n=1 Tax=Paraburkholderia aromaticivorans TaxID=2026199 RepID=UPI0038B7732F
MKIRTLKRSKQNGFTLIELMITVAIVGILAAVALPAYINYTIRAEVSEGFTQAGGLQTEVVEYYSVNGTIPKSMTDLGHAAGSYLSGKYSTVQVQNGNVQVGFDTPSDTPALGANQKLHSTYLYLSPTIVNGSIHWACLGTMNAAYIPSSCTNN